MGVRSITVLLGLVIFSLDPRGTAQADDVAALGCFVVRPTRPLTVPSVGMQKEALRLFPGHQPGKSPRRQARNESDLSRRPDAGRGRIPPPLKIAE
jgi:hypothetical protein